MENLSCKADIRRLMRMQRDALSKRRRRQAKEKAINALLSAVPKSGCILSYASFGSELCTWDFNFLLAKEKRLVLPRVAKECLRLYRVNNIKSELAVSKWGILEPNPDLCEPVTPNELSFAVVPGLAFDPFNHRLGYGKGHYDKLLSEFNGTECTLGIGFTEQQVKRPLPVEKTDIALGQIALF